MGLFETMNDLLVSSTATASGYDHHGFPQPLMGFPPKKGLKKSTNKLRSEGLLLDIFWSDYFLHFTNKRAEEVAASQSFR